MIKINSLKTAAALAILASGMAFAGTSTSNMSVSATVSNNCTISAGALAFGSYDPIVTNATTALDQTATLTVTCTQGASATVTLGQGANADTGSTDDAPLRRLNTGSEYLSYALYSDSARTTVFGNTAGTGAAYTGTGSSGTITVYGRITAGQTSANAGSYSDTVVATITF